MEKNNAFAKLFAALILVTIFGYGAAPAVASTRIRLRQVRDQPIVEVMINGAGPFDFIFDTGASSTVIDLDLAKQLSLSPIEASLVLTVVGSQTVPRYRIDTLSIGPKSVQNLRVLGTEMRGQHEISSRIRGLLGQDFLSGFDYILNYRDQRIEFEEGGEFADTLEGTRIPVERNRKRVLITAESSSPHKLGPRMAMDSGTVRLVVFKGNSGNCDLDIELDETQVFNASTIAGSQTLSVGRLRRLQIGTQKFFDLPVLVASAGGVDKGRPENGLLPTRLFRSIYFNNTQNFVILNPRRSPGWLLVSAMFQHVYAQENGRPAQLSGAAERALQYFESTGKGDLGDYLKSIRPPGISPEQRARLVSMIRKEDIVSPSIQRQAKLDALRPVLEYHERSAVEVKILRLGLAWAGMLEGAAVVVSEEAVDVLTAEELQAVVAHELGHEYFAAEYEAARKSKQYDLVKEVELRCDAIAVITLSRLRLNSELLLSGVSRLTKFNEARGVKNNPNLGSSVDERQRFCKAIEELLKIRESAASVFPAVPGSVSNAQTSRSAEGWHVLKGIRYTAAELIVCSQAVRDAVKNALCKSANGTIKREFGFIVIQTWHRPANTDSFWAGFL